MKITYADSGLRTELGHHSQSCSAIVPALRAAGHEVTILGPKSVCSALSEKLNVRPTFSRGCYERTNLDPYAGWMQDFLTGAVGTADELEILIPGPDGGGHHPDRIYWNSAQPTQLYAVLLYLHANPHARAVLEFGTSCGLLTMVDSDGSLRAQYPSPHENPTPTLLRFCSYLIDDTVRPRLTLCTFDERASQLFESVLDCPVQTFPVPRDAVAEPRLRGAGPAPLTISFLGHQRYGKGYHLVPAIVRDVLGRVSLGPRSVRFLIHNGDPDGWQVRETQAAVRQLAVEYPGLVEIDERCADPAVWQSLLDRSDLIVCPYWPEAFYGAYSAVACEAVANGIPLVVPAGTTLAEIVPDAVLGQMFGTWEAHHVASCVEWCVSNFAGLADAALAGASRWRSSHGGARTAAAILENLS